jgi:hypothetical protein
MQYQFTYLPETGQYATPNGFYLDPESGAVLRLKDVGYTDGKHLYSFIAGRYVLRQSLTLVSGR